MGTRLPEEVAVLGQTNPQRELLDARQFCGHLIRPGSFYSNLAELGDRLFCDTDFADMYDPVRGRQSVPPSLLAKVQLLQSFEGLSDREAVDSVRCDLRWKTALGLSLDDEGFDFTLLCYFRERLRTSSRPRRIIERFKAVADEAGLLTKRGARVLDSTPILSAVQTQDTVTMIRSALRTILRLLAGPCPQIRVEIQAALRRQDYEERAKPVIDWDDEEARIGLVDELVKDALVALTILEGGPVTSELQAAIESLATVAGQDVEWDQAKGRFQIRRGVAKDRVISTVDAQARHGRKSKHGLFDGYRAHVAVDPTTEIITEVKVAPANVPDGEMAVALLPELEAKDAEITAIGDTQYGTGTTRTALIEAGATVIAKAPPDVNSTGGFAKSDFTIDLEGGTATCPAGQTTSHVVHRAGRVRFQFPARICASCPLRPGCTSSRRGRSLNLGPHEQLLAEARDFQRTDGFKAVYNGMRPTVERVISRVVGRGGRKAKYRGTQRIQEQVELRASVQNFRRMTRLGLYWSGPDGWAATQAVAATHIRLTRPLLRTLHVTASRLQLTYRSWVVPCCALFRAAALPKLNSSTAS
jgi:IS5 family transposase